MNISYVKVASVRSRYGAVVCLYLPETGFGIDVVDNGILSNTKVFDELWLWTVYNQRGEPLTYVFLQPQHRALAGYISQTQGVGPSKAARIAQLLGNEATRRIQNQTLDEVANLVPGVSASVMRKIAREQCEAVRTAFPEQLDEQPDDALFHKAAQAIRGCTGSVDEALLRQTMETLGTESAEKLVNAYLQSIRQLREG